MPFMDGTGPLGNGPVGRGRGKCVGARGGFGQGAGSGRGTGRGMGLGQRRANGPARGQRAILEQQAGFIERQLDRIKRRVSDFAGEQPSK
jgi:hypothetical protein